MCGFGFQAFCLLMRRPNSKPYPFLHLLQKDANPGAAGISMALGFGKLQNHILDESAPCHTLITNILSDMYWYVEGALRGRIPLACRC